MNNLNCFSLSQGRKVFALPGKVDSQNTFGTHELIKQGAKLVSSLEDILEEFALPVIKNYAVKKGPQGNLKSNLGTQEETEIYNLISQESVQLDELVEKTNLQIPRVIPILLKLQMKGLIRELPGKQFIVSEIE